VGLDHVIFNRMPGGPRWWKNSELVQKVGVSEAQVQQIERIFQDSRLKLIDTKATLEKQEVQLEPLIQADNPDEGQITAQIEKVAAARAELEKANALMQVAIRRVLTLDQWKKLQSLQPQMMGPHRITIPLPPHAPGAPAIPPTPPDMD
jgi:Spy/CpxP family protein refolding chaperone